MTNLAAIALTEWWRYQQISCCMHEKGVNSSKNEEIRYNGFFKVTYLINGSTEVSCLRSEPTARLSCYTASENVWWQAIMEPGDVRELELEWQRCGSTQLESFLYGCGPYERNWECGQNNQSQDWEWVSMVKGKEVFFVVVVVCLFLIFIWLHRVLVAPSEI